MKISLPAESILNSRQFTFGVATAAFQIEGGADSRLDSIWDTFCDTPNKIKDGSNGKIACNHFEKWQQDVELIDFLGVDAYRFSVSWPRVINRDGSLNQQGVDFYIKLLDRLIEKNIKPYVTLYHWDLPQYLEDEGGWLNRQTAFRFRDYVDLISQAFGDRVYSYATLNEPFCSAYLGYEIGIHAPGKVGKQFGKKAVHNLLLAHGLAMQVLRKNSPDSLNGIVLNFSPCYAKTDNSDDIAAAELADQHFNHWYIKPVIDGCYPDIINDLPEEEKPEIEEGDLALIAQKMDYIGINYYTREVFQAGEEGDFVNAGKSLQPLTEMGWEVYPDGLTDILVALHQQYQLPPVYITENGAAMADSVEQGEINDVDRIEYFHTHLNAVNDAINQGVNIQGYFAWSLMDNFEWAEGYEKRFGIVYVDYASQKRTIKASGYAYKDFVLQRKDKLGNHPQSSR
ncbi:GH1 family beta-glucosidase [Neptunicella sp. SCSIO 80796]|uniref:GH1 family beta-glucosidase n=1 Tax=Neptunicella plasticusilytica TaxID=3117012 RepID=UPI003A4D3316